MMLRQYRSTILILLAAIMAAPLGGCVGLAVGGVATVATAARQERTVGNQLDDLVVQGDLESRLIQEDPQLFTEVNTTVMDGRVYLKGHVDTPESRREATRVAWMTPGVKAVHNDIMIGGPSGFQQAADDTWVSVKVRAELLSDARIKDVNYTIETQNGVVYLMGVAQSAEERQLALELARNTKGVKGVVDYLTLKEGAPAYASTEPQVSSQDSYMEPAAAPSYEPMQPQSQMGSGSMGREPVEVQQLPGAS